MSEEEKTLKVSIDDENSAKRDAIVYKRLIEADWTSKAVEEHSVPNTVNFERSLEYTIRKNTEEGGIGDCRITLYTEELFPQGLMNLMEILNAKGIDFQVVEMPQCHPKTLCGPPQVLAGEKPKEGQ